jgi:predicted metal-dependent hydrolase
MKSFTRFLERLKSDRQPEPLVLLVGSEGIAITLRKHASAKRMTLRLSHDGEGAILTLPKRGTRAEAQAFAERSKPWLVKQLAKKEPRRSFVDGARIPLRGELYAIQATGGTRGVVTCDHALRIIHVPGAGEHLARRLTDYFKAEAKRDLERTSRDYATKMQLTYKRLTVRDQKSRWGSCSADGALNYSWRLIMAPPQVLDYVAAHEVAHLKEMNHGPRFWRLVLTHCTHARKAKIWLKENGRKVHSYG